MKNTFNKIILISILFFGFTSPKNKLISNKTSNEALTFCKTKGFNTKLCVLIDMSIHSGKNRLFIYNFETKKIINSGLCAHGCCENTWGSDETKVSPKFSNTAESHCSSIGKFKIGKRGYSNWGIHINYKLHGLESTNTNAYKRTIVLHSWNMVSDKETFPNGTPEGWGCPAVSNTLMKELDKLLKVSKKPVLLWIYK